MKNIFSHPFPRPVVIAAVLGVAFVAVYYVVFHLVPDITANSNTFTLTGTVTKYDETPSYSDGAIIFQIDGQAVDIGGGLRGEHVMGSVYAPIAVGDEVEAKVMRSNDGHLTVFGCSVCYVRKHQ